jgi:protein-arginine kinase activator protein McsA
MLEDPRSWQNKTTACCKQCGRTFVRYVYEKLARCEDCRKADRVAVLPKVEKVPGRVRVKGCRSLH